jgi:hypothetical protein
MPFGALKHDPCAVRHSQGRGVRQRGRVAKHLMPFGALKHQRLVDTDRDEVLPLGV